MAKKKKSAQADTGSDAGVSLPANGSGQERNKAAKAAKAGEPSTSALIICRNKHWRYISSFHGPWLQLPPEVLESLAHTNYLSPRPRPIDPAVFYDVLKIRRHVDEATNLAVRATSGLTSAALNSSLNNSGGMLGPAAALGMGGGFGGGGGGTLSRERKHRMRELATGKLAAAYRLDEIAASVATMQSASTLEDVAQLVLQRSPADADAKYVHFFHEKIPSRMMAQCTPLDALDDIVAERPADGSALRTRALTRIFKDDYANSAKDLTAALATARYLAQQHRQGRDQLVLAKTPSEQPTRDWRTETKVPDEDQPSSLETQLLFHRAGVYFTIACGHVHAALDGLQAQEEAQAARDAQVAAGEDPAPETADEAAARLARAESRKQVRQNAKRALRDYTAFLSDFDYTPGIAAEVAEEFLRRYHSQSNGHGHGNGHSHSRSSDYQAKLDRLLEESSTSSPISEALTPYKKPLNSSHTAWPKLPPPPVFTLNQLFDSVPPASLPPYPPPPNTPPTPFPTNETLTYHPLLPEALHSLLLVHALLQTPPKELLRHAHNAARLVRLLDGYPIFLAARSPARTDWVEVLRRGGNWISLTSSWEKLCRPPTGQSDTHTNGTVARSGVRAGGRGGNNSEAETKEQKRQRQKHEAILEALADERVVDEASFQRAVRAREHRFQEDEKAEASTSTSTPALPLPSSSPSTREPDVIDISPNNISPAPLNTSNSIPKRWEKNQGNEYPIGTDRAEAEGLTASRHSRYDSLATVELWQSAGGMRAWTSSALTATTSVWGSRWNADTEYRKVAIQHDRAVAAVHSLIHVVPMAGALTLLILQWTGYWIDYNDDYSTGLQFAAKVHELAMQASVVEILLYLVRAGLVDSLVPLGALSGAMQATQLSYLWSLDFVAVARTKALRDRQKMIFVLAMPGLISLVSLVGPSSAVLMIPRAESLRVADKITMHLYGSKERLYPANFIAAYLHLDLDVPQFRSSLLNTYGYEVAGTGPSFQKETARSVVYTDPNVDYNRVIRFSRNFDPDHLESNSTMPMALIVNDLKFASGRTWEGFLRDFSISVVASHPVVSVLCRTQKFLEEHAIYTDVSYFKDDKISLDVLQDLRGISAESQEIECDAERQFWFNAIWVTSPEVGSNSSIVILLGGNSEVLTPSGCVLLEDLKAILDKANGTRNVNLQAKVCTVSSYWNTGEIKLVRMHEDILVAKTGRSSTTRLPDARPFSLDFDQVRGFRHQSFNQLVGTPRDSASGEHWPDTLSAALTVAISQISSKGLNVQDFLTLDWTPGADYTPFTFITTESGFGYGTRSTSVYLAMAVLSAYCIITLAYLAYTLITGTASTAWNSGIELFTLALQSRKPDHLGHTSVGIDSIKTLSEGVGVRVTEEDELDIVFANDKDFEKRGLRKVERNKEY